jgi:hypothetical protein
MKNKEFFISNNNFYLKNYFLQREKKKKKGKWWQVFQLVPPDGTIKRNLQILLLQRQ